MRIFLLVLLPSLLLFNCNGLAQKKEQSSFNVTKSDKEWKSILTEKEYYVMRKEGTEPAYSSKFNFEKASGTYVCKGCETPLFKSNHKYDSGSGWPSFYQTIDENVSYSVDYKIGYVTTDKGSTPKLCAVSAKIGSSARRKLVPCINKRSTSF